MFTHTKENRKYILFKIILCVFKRVAKRHVSFNEPLPYADPKTLTVALRVDSCSCVDTQ